MKKTKLFIILGIFACMIIALALYLNNNLKSETQSVVVNAGNNLTCNKLSEPKEIPPLFATYSCAAPGAYLESINLDKQEGQYFTSDSQGIKVTYGPVSVPIVSTE